MLASVLAGRTTGVPGRTYIYSQTKCLSPIVAGVPTPTPYGPDGTGVHFLYDAFANMRFRTSADPSRPDYVPQKILAEFGTPAVFTVPFNGTLAWIGGNPAADFLTYIYYNGPEACSGDPTDVTNYTPMYHWLKRLVTRAAGFVVPDNHTFLVGYNPTDTFLVNGFPVTPSTNSPGTTVSPGDFITPTGADTFAITGWLG